MKRGRKAKYYILYKGEVILSFGTIKEIAIKMKLSEKTLYYYRTPTYKKRAKNNRYELKEAG